MKRCTRCALRYPFGDDEFCARCGSPLITVSFFERNQKALVPAIIIGSFVLLLVIGLSVENNTPSRSATSTAPQVRRASTAAAINRLRDKLMGVPEGRSIFLAVEASSVEGVARVQVSNAWYDSRPHQRRQLTQMMANLWAAEMQGEPSILHVYDVTGREIAGTKAFGGIWTEDDQ